MTGKAQSRPADKYPPWQLARMQRVGHHQDPDLVRIEARARLISKGGGHRVKLAIHYFWFEDEVEETGVNGKPLKQPRIRQRERVETFGAMTESYSTVNDALGVALELARTCDLPAKIANRQRLLDAVEDLIREKGEEAG